MSRPLEKLLIVVVVCTACWARPVPACPICDSPTGEQVRTGIAGDGLTVGLLATLLPFALTAGIVSVIHLGGGGGGGPPWRRDDGNDR